MISRILIVCVGNVCRSPMAEGLMKNLLPGYSIVSAGLGARDGSPADPVSVELMQERGIDISAHRARQLDTVIISEADLVLVMELDHQHHLEQLFPLARGKIFRLCERSKIDIADPYAQSKEAFENAAELITLGVSEWIERIQATGPARNVANN